MVPVLGIAGGWIAYKTAILANETEKIKNEQTQTNEKVRDNETRTDQLQDQVNDIAGPADIRKVAELLSGAWRGTYRCDQGLTGLELKIYVEGQSSLLATFDFFPVESNPDVPNGSYAMRGTFTTDHFELQGDYWLKKPSSYGMVGLSGNIPPSGSDGLTGSVNGTTGGCHNYNLKKISNSTSKPPV
ncbi:hypothetical protein [Actinoplanes sp. CA-252034]|uniref:hypothetical protein n=1 Tax=Actinoplanes sp. CA-252034 TaxID=3239906 RepID=UPI003D991849